MKALKRVAAHAPAVVGIVVGVAFAAGGLATAAVPDTGGTVRACYHVDGQGQVGPDSTLRVLDAASSKNGGNACRKDERAVTLTGPELPHNCAAGQTLKFSLPADAWGCADDLDTNTTYSAGTGLALNGTTFSTDPSVVQSRVAGSCGAGQGIQSIAQDGTVSCGDFGGSQHVFAPSPTQINSTTGSVVLIDRGGFRLVGRCTPVAAAIVVTDPSGHTINVVSDGRQLHKGESITSNEVGIATANVSTPIDRGDFDVADASAGTTLNGSFYTVFLGGSPAACQFNASALGA